MNNILETIIFNGYTVKDILITIVIAIGVLMFVRWLSGFFSSKKNKYVESVECLNCHWRGQVSTLKGRCPKCNEPLGSQKARRTR